MRTPRSILVIALCAGLSASGCVTLKYELLKGTSLPNPPTGPIKVYISEFPVESKAAVVDPRAANSATQGQEQYVTNALASKGSPLTTISRSSRIEDLSGSVLRELRKERLRTFTEMVLVKELNEDNTREIDNPFIIVADAADADIEISGSALINSQRISKVFSQQTKNIEITVSARDMRSGKTHELTPLQAGVVMTFNSRELEQAMAIAAVTSLTRKLLF